MLLSATSNKLVEATSELSKFNGASLNYIILDSERRQIDHCSVFVTQCTLSRIACGLKPQNSDRRNKFDWSGSRNLEISALALRKYILPNFHKPAPPTNSVSLLYLDKAYIPEGMEAQPFFEFHIVRSGVNEIWYVGTNRGVRNIFRLEQMRQPTWIHSLLSHFGY